MKTSLLLIVAVALTIGLQEARANSFAILLGSIQGESQDPSLPGGIELESVNLNGPFTLHILGSLYLQKKYDRATPLLLNALSSRKFIRHAQLFGKAPGSPPQTLLKVDLRDVLIVSISHEKTEPGSASRESVGLQFSSALFTYYESNGTANAAYLPPVGGPDSDGDGIPDAIEIHYGLDPFFNDAGLDLDGDGLSNRTEIHLGFNPASGESFFRAEVTPVEGNPNAVDVTWESVPNKPYAIEWSPDLVSQFTNFANHTPQGTRATVRLSKIGLRGFFKVRPL